LSRILYINGEQRKDNPPAPRLRRTKKDKR
jgi:hypothetical protein